MPGRRTMLKVALMTALFSILLARPASAVAISIHPSSTGLSAMTFGVIGSAITIEETLDGSGIGALLISGLTPGVSYTVTKRITVAGAADITAIALELLDPAGDPDDADDPTPYPSFVPAGFTTSTDNDGLSFAQGSGIPRTSSHFATVFADELSHSRDFLDFTDGLAGPGATFTLTFGLRLNPGSAQEPFILMQRPNARSVAVPEPASILMLGGGLAAAIAARRRAQRKAA